MSYKLLALISLLSFTVYAQEINLNIAYGVIEYQDLFNASICDSVACYLIPAVVTAPNGDLIVATVFSVTMIQSGEDEKIQIRAFNKI